MAPGHPAHRQHGKALGCSTRSEQSSARTPGESVSSDHLLVIQLDLIIIRQNLITEIALGILCWRLEFMMLPEREETFQ